MSRVSLLAAGLLLVALVGCQSSTSTSVSVSTSPTESETPIAGTPVVLKLPNMVCGGCASAVTGDLAKVDGIAGIKTDIEKNECRFVVTDDKFDWEAMLASLAKTNSHIEGYSVVKGG